MNLSVVILGVFIGGVFLTDWMNRKKAKEPDILLKINELERNLDSQQFLVGSLLSIKQYMLSHSQLEAAQYLTEFTNLLKNISFLSRQKRISLAEELETTLLYVELEKKRLNNRLEFSKQIQENLFTEKIKVKPLFLLKKIEKLIEKQKDEILQIRLVVRSNERFDCEMESDNIGNFILWLNVPNENK